MRAASRTCFAPATVSNLGPGFDLLGLAIEGIGMYAVTAWLEGRMTGWAFRSQQSAGG